MPSEVTIPRTMTPTGCLVLLTGVPESPWSTMAGLLWLLYTWSTVNIFLSEKILTVDLGIFFSNLLDLSNLRVLSCSVSRGPGVEPGIAYQAS